MKIFGRMVPQPASISVSFLVLMVLMHLFTEYVFVWNSKKPGWNESLRYLCWEFFQGMARFAVDAQWPPNIIRRVRCHLESCSKTFYDANSEHLLFGSTRLFPAENSGIGVRWFMNSTLLGRVGLDSETFTKISNKKKKRKFSGIIQKPTSRF